MLRTDHWVSNTKKVIPFLTMATVTTTTDAQGSWRLDPDCRSMSGAPMNRPWPPHRVSWVCLLAVLAGCGGQSAGAAVSVGGHTTQDGGDDDAGAAPLSPRGPAPTWPNAEAEVVVPYRGGDVSELLRLDARLGELDLQMNIDTTSSMSDEIDALQSELRSTLVPMLVSRVARASFGVSAFADFPVAPFGARSDQPFRVLAAITDDVSSVENAVARLDQPLGAGGDDPEAGGEALFQIATGAGYSNANQTLIAPASHSAESGGGRLGGVGFRPEALHIVLHATDALAHTSAQYASGGLPGLHGVSEAIDALKQLPAHVIAIMSTSCTDDTCRQSARYTQLRTELSKLALNTGATMPADHGVCRTGIAGAPLPTYEATCPLVFDVRSDGKGLASTIVDSVVGLVDRLTFSEVHAEVSEDPLEFVQNIEATLLPQPAGASVPQLADRLPARKHDGIPDTFTDVHQTSLLGFRVHLRDDRLAASDVPQRFRVRVRIVGDGVVLQERVLRVVVPAGSPGDGDAGNPADDAGR
jgi:hypothetical protein